MAEVKKKDDLRSLIKELEDRRDESPATTKAPPRTGFITVEEAAEILGSDPNAVRKMMRRGEIKSARIGRRKYVSADDLNRYKQRMEEEEAVKMSDPNRLLTVSEVADQLRFSEAQVYDMLNKKILLGFRIGAGAGSWRVQKKDLDEYVGRQRQRSVTK